MKKVFVFICISAFVMVAKAQPWPQQERTVRVMSYNTHNGIGMDNVTDYRRIADVIASAAPDVVALQELDSATQRSAGVDVLGRLASLTAMYPVYGASIPYGAGKYGIGLLSKEKPISWQRIPLPGREELRSLLVVEFKEYIACCTHLSLNAEDRLASVAVITRAVAGSTKPVFLAGDINATPESPVLDAFKENWTMLNDVKQFTFPSGEPARTIDYIFGYTPKGDACAVWQTRVIQEPIASDHLPLFADVRLKTAKNAIFRSPVYLQEPANEAITVMWLTSVPAHSWVEYGVDSMNMQRVQSWMEGEAVANNTLNRIRLTGLKPGTRYYYRVHSREITLYQPYRKEFGETAVSKTSSFTTWDAKKTDFTAVIFNDLHDRYPLFDKLFQHVKDVPYDLVIFNGDCIADVQSEDIAVRTIAHYSRNVGADRVPTVYMRGNHETRGAYSPFLWNLLGLINGHSYGAFSLGDTRFVLLDCGEDKPDETPVYYGLNDFTQYRKDQAAFLKTEIASKSFKSATKRVLLHHIPVYGMREDAFLPCREYWGDILAKAPFDICLNGHTHRFNPIVKGADGNAFPVVIGGGSRDAEATVAILRKQGKQMTLTVLNVDGKTLLEMKL